MIDGKAVMCMIFANIREDEKTDGFSFEAGSISFCKRFCNV